MGRDFNEKKFWGRIFGKKNGGSVGKPETHNFFVAPYLPRADQINIFISVVNQVSELSPNILIGPYLPNIDDLARFKKLPYIITDNLPDTTLESKRKTEPYRNFYIDLLPQQMLSIQAMVDFIALNKKKRIMLLYFRAVSYTHLTLPTKA